MLFCPVSTDIVHQTYEFSFKLSNGRIAIPGHRSACTSQYTVTVNMSLQMLIFLYACLTIIWKSPVSFLES